MKPSELLRRSAAVRREIQPRLLRDLTRLDRTVEGGLDLGESTQEFINRVSTELMHLFLVKHRRLFDPIPGPARKGRPRKPKATKSSRRPGRPTKFTSDVEAWFLRDIDQRKVFLDEQGRRATDADALRWSIYSHVAQRLIASGVDKDTALSRANEAATGPLFRTRRSHLARLRARQRRGEFST